MPALSRDDLWSLEEYAEKRAAFRAHIIEHKKRRQVAIGDHLTLYFEDRETVQYQVQEMLRIEKVFEPEGIEDELSAYNPLIPNGGNWKATCMLEYADVDERRVALAALRGIEDQVWVQVEGFDKVFAIADEDLERSDEEKTSAVHFMRFELDNPMREALKGGAGASMGTDHPNCALEVGVERSTLDSLVKDLD